LISHLVALQCPARCAARHRVTASSDGGMTSGIDTLMEQMEADADTREKAASDAWHTFCSQNKIAGAEAPGASGVTSEW